jgi:hypothetical protein
MELPRYHRMRGTLYRLEGSACRKCAHRIFPPRPVCPRCKAQDLEVLAFSGRGTLYSFTRVLQPPRGFTNFGTYSVGMVRLDEGPMLSAQIADADGTELQIGMPVEMVTRKLKDAEEHGFILYGYKFRPCIRAAGA